MIVYYVGMFGIPKDIMNIIFDGVLDLDKRKLDEYIFYFTWNRQRSFEEHICHKKEKYLQIYQESVMPIHDVMLL